MPSTLARITSKFTNHDDMLNLEKLKLKNDICQRRSIIMIENVYIESVLLYHGGTLIEKPVNHIEKLTKTMLAYVVKFLYTGTE